MAAKTAPAKKTTKAEAAAKKNPKGTGKTKPEEAPKPAPTTAGKKPTKLARHPLSERYGPKMTSDELHGLADNIKAHGQHEPIIMFEGMVLAGWNRYEGCLLAGVEPDVRDLPAGKDPVAVAFGTNFIRRKLGSVQKAFFGAQYCAETGAKQADVAKMLGCNLNRLNQCCQLLKRDDKDAQSVATALRDSSEMGSATFDEQMLELGIAKAPTAPPPRPARAVDPLVDGDDDVDFEDDDITGGAIEALGDDPNDDDPSPDPAVRKKKGSKAGEPVGDDAPLPTVGSKRTGMTNSFETPVSRAGKHFRHLSTDEQRQFIKFTWKSLKAALDAAISHGDVEYELPGVKPDPSLIARTKPAGKLDDGHEPTKAKKGSKPAPKTKPKGTAKKPAPAKASGRKAKDADI